MHLPTRHLRTVSAILVFVVLGLTHCTTQQNTDMSVEAWRFITIKVENSLGNATIIKFPSDGAHTVTELGDNRFQVTSYVDYRDSQGDLQRSYFYGTAVLNKGSWSVESLHLSK